MGLRFSLRRWTRDAIWGTLLLLVRLLPAMSAVVAITTGAAASPDCSAKAVGSASDCATKLDYCTHTSIVLVFAVRERGSGLSEQAAFAKLSSNTTHEAWYVTYREIVRSIVHQVYTKDSTYKKLRARIAPSSALAVSELASGCSADRSISVEPK